MLIIAGKAYVAPEERDRYVELHEDLIRRACSAPGSLDAAITADPLEAGRVNVFELWDTEEHLTAWRAVANAPEDAPAMLGDDVRKFQISSAGPPF